MEQMTVKELSALEQQLTMEQLLIKKYRTYANRITDPQLRTKCQQVAARHQEHYTRLMGHLN